MLPTATDPGVVKQTKDADVEVRQIESTVVSLVKRPNPQTMIVEVKSDADLALAGTAIAQLRAFIKGQEEKRTGITGLLLSAKKSIDDLFAPAKARAESVKKMIEAGAAKWIDSERIRKQREQDELDRKAREEEAAAQKKLDDAAALERKGDRLGAMIAQQDAVDHQERAGAAVTKAIEATPQKVSTTTLGTISEKRPFVGTVNNTRSVVAAFMADPALYAMAAAAGLDEFVAKFVRAAVRAGIRSIGGATIEQETRIG